MKPKSSVVASERAGRQLPLVMLLSSVFVSMAVATKAHAQPALPNAFKNTAAPRTESGSTARSTSGDAVLGAITVSEQGVIDPEDEPYRSTGSSAYISGEQIERFRGTSVGDFLSGVPGVINADARNSGAVDVNIRGMQGQGRVPFIVDGATQETTTWQGYNGSTPRSYIDPDFISSISIEKGISSAADATGATGGVVRAKTLVVEDILLPGKQYGIRLKGGFITNSSRVPEAGTLGGWNLYRAYWRGADDQQLAPSETYETAGMNRPPLFTPTGGAGSIAFAGTTQFIDVVAAYVRRKNGNYHAGTRGDDEARFTRELNEYGRAVGRFRGLTHYRGGEEVLNTSLDNTSWMLKAKLKPSVDQSLELGVRKYNSDFGSILTSRLSSVLYQSWLSNVTLDTYTAQYRWNPQENDLFDVRIDAFQNNLDNRINYLDLVVSTNRERRDSLELHKSYGYFFQWIGSQREGITASNVSKFKLGESHISVTYGGAFVREDTGFPPGVDAEWFIEKYEFGYPREGWREEASGFTSLEFKPIDRITFNASTRYSHYVTSDTMKWEKQSAFKRRDQGWSPMGSIMIEPLDGLQIYTKYGKSVRAPSVFESLTGTSIYYPPHENPPAPERAKNLEIGLNYLKANAFLPGDKLRVHAAHFNNRIDGYLTRAGLKRLDPYARPSSVSPYTETLGRINLRFARMQGVELSAEYDMGRYFGSFAWNRYTDVMFCAPEGLIYEKGPLCSSGGLPHSFSLQQIPPRDTLTFNLGTRLLERKLVLGSRVNYVGSRFAESVGKNIGMDGIQPSRWNPYLLVDAYASYRMNKQINFDLAIDNITDRYYMDGINAARMPAPGRTIRGSMTVKF